MTERFCRFTLHDHYGSPGDPPSLVAVNPRHATAVIPMAGGTTRIKILGEAGHDLRVVEGFDTVVAALSRALAEAGA